jgi:hypothetical protein
MPEPKKFIVITTIYEPTEATRRFCALPGWQVIVVGDLKTPHAAYADLDCIYLHPDEQQDKYPALSDAIGWRSIQRRNIGFVEAWHRGADIMATVDDDNIPYDHWGQDLLVGRTIEADLHEPALDIFDPLSVTASNHLWHRGYPIEYLTRKNEVMARGKVQRDVLVQADLWDGDPDVDAIARLSHRPEVRYDEITGPYCSNRVGPFNSQNTFLAREVIPYYVVFPHVGRMDDIWGSYFLQCLFPDSVVYNRASVYQDRNEQDLITNLENEVIGYRQTLNLVRQWQETTRSRDARPLGVPDDTLRFWDAYRDCFSSDA